MGCGVMAEAKINRTMTADGQLMMAVVNKDYPFQCLTIHNGKWTSEFPFFTGSLSECRDWVIKHKSEHTFTDFMAVDYDSWVRGKAKYDAEKDAWVSSWTSWDEHSD